jgi:hypothetical protein
MGNNKKARQCAIKKIAWRAKERAGVLGFNSDGVKVKNPSFAFDKATEMDFEYWKN